MNKRRGLLAAGAAAALLAAALWPLSQWMSKAGDGALDAKQASAAAALEVQAAYEALEAGRAVEPMMAMEDAWAIEDTRAEAQTPLVTEMLNGRDVLGYDAESQTFYCTLGMETGESWPELALAARGAQDVRVAWIDEYGYDACADAIAEGYRYELLAYTQTEYAYIGVVFTGLPIVTLRVEDELGETYVPGRMTLAAAGYEAVSSAALAHLRGGGMPLSFPEDSLRVELHELSDRGEDKKRLESLLGMDPDSDWLLLVDRSNMCVSNHMAWDLWRRWNPDGQAFALLENRWVELFVDDEYMGLYQLMQRIDAKKEIERMGGDPDTDICMRVITAGNKGKRPIFDRARVCNYFVELRYKPERMTVRQAVEHFEPYHRMNSTVADYRYGDDAEFAEVALESMDIRELMEYFVFTQAASLGYDNVFNNVYLWALRKDGRYVYYPAPWDMDRGFVPVFTYRGSSGSPHAKTEVDYTGEDAINLWQEQIVRMLNLNVGDCRSVLWEVWNEKKEALLSDDSLYQWFMEQEDMLNRSGAYRRSTFKWMGEEKQMNLAEQAAYMIGHRDTVEFYFREMWPAGETSGAL